VLGGGIFLVLLLHLARTPPEVDHFVADSKVFCFSTSRTVFRGLRLPRQRRAAETIAILRVAGLKSSEGFAKQAVYRSTHFLSLLQQFVGNLIASGATLF
jgi:hypothetical protein